MLAVVADELDARLEAEVNHALDHRLDRALVGLEPQLDVVRPDEGLAEFRDWFRKEYINKKMPIYLLGKVKDGQLTAPAATAAIEAFTPKRIAPPPVRPQRF